jgi:hypothetical protein
MRRLGRSENEFAANSIGRACPTTKMEIVQVQASESTVVAVIAEKPSVARDIARVLGSAKARRRLLAGERLHGDLGQLDTWYRSPNRMRSTRCGDVGQENLCRCYPTIGPWSSMRRHEISSK